MKARRRDRQDRRHAVASQRRPLPLRVRTSSDARPATHQLPLPGHHRPRRRDRRAARISGSRQRRPADFRRGGHRQIAPGAGDAVDCRSGRHPVPGRPLLRGRPRAPVCTGHRRAADAGRAPRRHRVGAAGRARDRRPGSPLARASVKRRAGSSHVLGRRIGETAPAGWLCLVDARAVQTTAPAARHRGHSLAGCQQPRADVAPGAPGLPRPALSPADLSQR
jgi:hypothetical protein